MFHAVRLTAFNSETTHYGGLEKKMTLAGAGASFGLMKDRVGGHDKIKAQPLFGDLNQTP